MEDTQIDWEGVPAEVVGFFRPKKESVFYGQRDKVYVKWVVSDSGFIHHCMDKDGLPCTFLSSQWEYHERPKEKQFPEAGTECQVYVSTESWHGWVDCFVVGMDEQGFCVYSLPQEMFKHVGLCYDGEANPENFRPLTEESKKEKELIDKVCSIVGSYDLAMKVINCLNKDSA